MLARWCCEKGGALKKWWHARFLYAAQGAIVWSGRTRHSLATGCMSDVNIYIKFSFVGAGFTVSFVEIMGRSIQIEYNVDKHMLYII